MRYPKRNADRAARPAAATTGRNTRKRSGVEKEGSTDWRVASRPSARASSMSAWDRRGSRTKRRCPARPSLSPRYRVANPESDGRVGRQRRGAAAHAVSPKGCTHRRLIDTGRTANPVRRPSHTKCAVARSAREPRAAGRWGGFSVRSGSAFRRLRVLPAGGRTPRAKLH